MSYWIRGAKHGIVGGKCRGLKKDGEKIKTELKKLEKFRFKDSERL